MIKKQLFVLLVFFLTLPTSSLAENQKRKYRIRDLSEAKIEMKRNPKKEKRSWFKKLERFIWVAGTLTLVLWVPGSSLQYADRSGNSRVKIGSHPNTSE